MVTYRVKQKVTVFQGDEQAQVNILSFYEFPDKYRSEIVNGSRMEVYIVNGSEARMLKGKVGKVKNAGLKEEKRDLLFASVRRDVINIARHSMNPDLTLSLQGTETINGTPCKIIDVVLDGVRSKLWVAEDGRALKQTFKEIGGKNKKPVPWELYFSEYKDWQGRKIPARWDIKVDGSRLEIVELEEWKENVDIDPRKFDVKE
jgi:outer membrane lipoprotein-sorting protein